MVHVNKKLKKDDSEQQLEDLLFGDNTEDLWSKTGQELEQEEDDEVDDTEVNDEEDINEATFFFDSGPFTGNNDDEVDYEAEQQAQQQEDTSDEESEEDSDSDEDRYALTKAAWIQSVKFKDMPIYHAEFHPSGDEIVVSGRRSYFYIYNIQTGIIDRCPGIWGREEKSLEDFSISPCGRYIAFLGVSGVIIVVSYSTKKWYCNLKVNKTVESVSWSSDGNYLFGFSGEGQVYQFDVQNKECIKRWNDEGCIGPSVIRVSPDERYYATGSSTGIVNVYDRSVLEPESINPKPFKVIESLTTRVNNILFNHDSQLMVISSQSKREQLRVIHVPTGTAYANWPTDGTPLNTVKCVAFSPNSDYLAIANKKGKVLLYTLKHYALKD
ncbi:hypothetical protein RMCBS344292_06389 [Rhizopus microsporus]|nr:hypothetical protein RMCBS344292_06389 [Rhizopus microsporus]